jgi:hypothetical protein
MAETKPGPQGQQPSSGPASNATQEKVTVPVVGVSRPPSEPQKVSQELKDKGLKSRESADTVSDKQFETLGKGQSLDLLRDSVEAHGEAARRARNNELVGEEFDNPLGKFVGADDSEPEKGEFEPATGDREFLSKRDEKSVRHQQKRAFEELQSQMIFEDGGTPITGGQVEDPNADEADAEGEARVDASRGTEAERREAELRKSKGSTADKEPATTGGTK